jgi:hypothetical protein
MKTPSRSSRVRTTAGIFALVALAPLVALAAEPDAEDIRAIRLRQIYQAAGVEGTLEDRVHEVLRQHWRELDRLRRAFAARRLDVPAFDAKLIALAKQVDRTVSSLLGAEKFARWCTYRDDDTKSKAGRDAIARQSGRLPSAATRGDEAQPEDSWPAVRCASVRRSLVTPTLLLSSYEQTYVWAHGYAIRCTLRPLH